MYWLTARNAVVFIHRCRSLSFLLNPSLRRPFPLAAPQQLIRQSGHIFCFKERKLYTKSSKKLKQSKISLEEKDYAHVIWWKERLEMCRKPSSIQLVKRLTFSNLLGVDSTLKNGSLKEGNLNWEMLQFKSKFPREVLLCRVGEFYEAIGIDACILVEYAGLNPFGGLRTDSIPRAGCPVMVSSFPCVFLALVGACKDVICNIELLFYIIAFKNGDSVSSELLYELFSYASLLFFKSSYLLTNFALSYALGLFYICYVSVVVYWVRTILFKFFALS